MKKILAVRAVLAAALLWAASLLPAAAQTAPNWSYGQVPTVAQWNAIFAAKQDYLGAPPLLTTGGTMLGKLVTVASSSSVAGFNLQIGSAPSAPINGDMWATSGSLYARIGGVTYDLIGATAVSITVGTTTVLSGTDKGLLYNNAGVLGNLATGNNGILNTNGSGVPSITSSPLISGSMTAASFIPSGATVPTNGLYLPTTNTLGWAINSAAAMQLTATALSPATAGGSSLGTTALGWQNLFGNTGFVLNLANGNWVATHSSGILTVGTGDLRVTTAGTNAASVVTVGGTQTLTGKTLTSPTINTATISSPSISTPTITGGTHTAITSLGIRSTGSGAFDLTLANTENLTAGRTLTFTLNDAARTINLAGNLTLSGAFPLTLTQTGSTNVTLPTTGTLATLAGSEALTNKTITSSTNQLGTVTMALGSDATGDIYYRNSGGQLTRLGIGTNGQVLQVNTGLPSWQAGSSAGSITQGSTTIGGVCSSGQILYNNAGTLGCQTQVSLVAGSGILVSGSPAITVSSDYATKAEQETGTSTSKNVNPSVQKYHDSAVKGWIYVTQSGGTYTTQASYNMSASKNSTGNLTLTFSTAFGSSNYSLICNANEAGSYNVTSSIVNSSSATVLARNSTSGAQLDVGFACHALGRQ